MKRIIFLSALSVLILSASDCNNKSEKQEKYKARFEIKAICSNYTFSLIEGKMDTSKVEANWTDENTGKSYKNAFAVSNPCDIPESMKQGDEFYFVIDTIRTKECIVCMAYYPKPQKVLSIKIVK